MTALDAWRLAQQRYRTAIGGDRLRAHRRLVKTATRLLRVEIRRMARAA